MRNLRVDPAVVFVTTVACLALVLLGYALWAGGPILGLVAILIVGAAVAAAAGFDLPRLLLMATCIAVFFTGLPEVHFGPVRVRLALVVLAVLLALASFARGGRLWLPGWIIAPAGAIVLATALVLMFPISETYLSGRLVDLTFGPQPTADIEPALSSLLSVVGLSLAAIACSLAYQRAPTWIATAFVAGNALSALVAYTDYLELTSLSATFGGCGVSEGRACGFSSHPVVLTIGTVYATGLAAWFLVRPSVRSRIFGAITLPALVLGTYASGTRGGVLSVVFLLTAAILILPPYRRYIVVVLLGTATAAATVFVWFPSLGHQILVTTRLVDSASTRASNSGRIEAMSQGWEDFLESPIYGIGLHVLFQAHNGYIQSLASGGLILLTGLLVLQFGALRAAFRLLKTEAMAPILAATMLTRIGYEGIEGALVDYAALVPITLIAALVAQQRASHALLLPNARHGPGSSLRL